MCHRLQEVYDNSVMQKKTTIIGIDPGSINLGYGILTIESGSIKHIDHGVISNNKLSSNERLGFLRFEIDRILQKYNPDMASIEKVFLGENPQSVFKLGLARGAVLSSLAICNVAIYEYAPTTMKKLVTGHGHAKKDNVAQAVKNLLRLDGELKFDAADALGLAYMHAKTYDLQSRFGSIPRI